MKKAAMLLFFALCCFGAAWIGAAATYPSIPTWYAQIKKPGFTPPNAIFGPVWTLLYAMMSVAAWRIWRKAGWKPAPFILFYSQLALNAFWSVLFFGWHRPDWALADISALWALVGATFLAFRRVDGPAAWLLLPYWLWLSFAGLLNYSIWKLN